MRRGLELSRENGVEYADFYGSILDLHMHPRIFDAILPSRYSMDGKAGARLYSSNALESGITAGVAMTNESLRIYSPDTEDGTDVIPYPVTTPDRLLAAASIVQQLSLIRMGINMSVDPDIIGLGQHEKTPRFTTKHIKKVFSDKHVIALSAGLKIFGAESTGGLAIPLDCIIPTAEIYNEYNPGKPVPLHLEGEDVGTVLADWPNDIPATIAHVSSKQEMEAAIIAKESGKNVWIEATPHHMFLTEETTHAVGPLGCMKPSLKSAEDRQYLWDHKEYIDQIGSDCAPHRYKDKFGPNGEDLEKPAFGVTNHNVLVPLFLEVIHAGRITQQELYDWLVRKPHERIGIPIGDTVTRFEMSPITAEQAEIGADIGYGPFSESPETPDLRGHMESIHFAGQLMVWSTQVRAKPNYANLIRY